MQWTFLDRELANELNEEYSIRSSTKNECSDICHLIYDRILRYKDTPEFESMFLEIEYIDYTLTNLFEDDILELRYIKSRLHSIDWVSSSLLNKKQDILDRRLKLDSIKININNG